eukprot:SAG25_NODE_835_length_5135_cov_3.455719_2_plen_109_part_00
MASKWRARRIIKYAPEVGGGDPEGRARHLLRHPRGRRSAWAIERRGISASDAHVIINIDRRSAWAIERRGISASDARVVINVDAACASSGNGKRAHPKPGDGTRMFLF